NNPEPGLLDIQVRKSNFDTSTVPPVINKETIENCLADSTSNAYRCNSLIGISVFTSNPTFHNFSSYERTIDPPALVKNKPDCGGIPGCKIPVTTIMFDEIGMYDGERTKVRREFDV